MQVKQSIKKKTNGHHAEYDNVLWRLNERLDCEGVDICAKHKRGMAGFMPHLPLDVDIEREFYKTKLQDPQELEVLRKALSVPTLVVDFVEKISEARLRLNGGGLDNYEFKPHKKSLSPSKAAADYFKNIIAKSNVIVESYFLDGLPVNVVISLRKIKRYEPIGFCYGTEYWQRLRATPLLLHKNGGLLPKNYYKRVLVSVPLMKGGLQSDAIAQVQLPFPLVTSNHIVTEGGYYQSLYVARNLLALANGKGADEFGCLPLSTFATWLLATLQLKQEFRTLRI